MSIGLAHEMPSARMSADRRAPSAAIAGAVCAAGAAATAVAFWAADQSPILVDAHSAAVARALFVASYIAVGTYTWRRRPAGRLGPLVISAA